MFQDCLFTAGFAPMIFFTDIYLFLCLLFSNSNAGKVEIKDFFYLS